MTEENKKTKEKSETPKEIVKDIEKGGVKEEIAKKEEKLDEKAVKESEEKKSIEKTKTDASKTEEKPEVKKEEKIIKKEPKKLKKKTEAVVNVRNLPISTKHSIAICSFIKGKKIEDSIKYLEDVLKFKKAIPMKGEIPHRKGKGMMSGRFPKNASEIFLKTLKSLSANTTNLGIENPLVFEAVANIGERPYGRFGQVRKKRTHLIIKAKSSGGKK